MRDAPLSPRPLIMPLGDQAIIIRFDKLLSDAANRSAIALAQRLEADAPAGVLEIDPNLVSVLVRYDPRATSFAALSGELRLRMKGPGVVGTPTEHEIGVRFGGEDAPDLEEASSALGLSPKAFIAAHNAQPLRVLTTGFAPGFVYCGFHPTELTLPRRQTVRSRVEPGTVLFAAGQTAICATAIPTGWHVIGRTSFRNFDPERTPPTKLREGDLVRFRPC